METQRNVKLKTKGVDFVASRIPDVSREELKRRIILGAKVYEEKLSKLGIEKPLSGEDLKFVTAFQYYNLFTTATPEELAEIQEDETPGESDEEFESFVVRFEAGETP